MSLDRLHDALLQSDDAIIPISDAPNRILDADGMSVIPAGMVIPGKPLLGYEKEITVMNSAPKDYEECESKPYAQILISQEDFALVREVLERGFNTWPRQQEPEGKLIMRLIEALK